MPDRKYFLSLGGSFLLGAAVICISLALAWLLMPYLLPVFASAFPYIMQAALAILIFMIILAAVYAITLLGVLVRYLFRPMEVSKEKKAYSIAGIREAGLRQRGKSRGRRKGG